MVPNPRRIHAKPQRNSPTGALLPFSDNIDRFAMSNVRYVVQARGSKRDQDVIAAADEYGMTMCLTGVRLFTH
jgi:phosphoribosylaminoimidazolecarboxamide formyltransferase / IMP cyclohydrolase